MKLVESFVEVFHFVRSSYNNRFRIGETVYDSNRESYQVVSCVGRGSGQLLLKVTGRKIYLRKHYTQLFRKVRGTVYL